MSKNTTQGAELPVGVKACIAVLGSFLLLPFVLPAASLLLLAAAPIIMCFVPWVSLSLFTVRPKREVDADRPAPSQPREQVPAPHHPAHAHAT